MNLNVKQEADLNYEEEHVHKVYTQIASHFSSTRFKPWPVVDDFIRSLPVGSLGLDVGCGNGKYLTVRNDIFIIASDRSHELLKFAHQHQPHSALVADTLNLPHPISTFDFAICIAVVHHLSTPERRRFAIHSILQTLRPPRVDPGSNSPSLSHISSTEQPPCGQALIFVWALEQKNSRRGWDTGMDQDVLVPWVLKGEHDKRTRATNQSEVPQSTPIYNKDQSNKDNSDATDSIHPETGERTFHRYYHLYREGELENDIEAVGGRVIRKGYDRDNWWAICERATDTTRIV